VQIATEGLLSGARQRTGATFRQCRARVGAASFGSLFNCLFAVWAKRRAVGNQRRVVLAPTLRVGAGNWTGPSGGCSRAAERRGVRSHAEHGNEKYDRKCAAGPAVLPKEQEARPSSSSFDEDAGDVNVGHPRLMVDHVSRGGIAVREAAFGGDVAADVEVHDVPG
jgi:hypothetical protein